jgi:hypothetical protein
MIHLTPVAAIIVLLLLVPGRLAKRLHGFRILLPGIVAWLCMDLVPLGQLPINAYLKGVIGELSITSLALLGWLLFQRQYNLSGAPEVMQGNRRWIDIKPIVVLSIFASLVLYPAALGLSYIDSYAWGFDFKILFLLIAICGITLALKSFFLVAMILTLVLFGYIFQVQTSLNFWDYLVDPLLVITCWAWMFSWLRTKYLKTKNTQGEGV